MLMKSGSKRSFSSLKIIHEYFFRSLISFLSFNQLSFYLIIRYSFHSVDYFIVKKRPRGTFHFEFFDWVRQNNTVCINCICLNNDSRSYNVFYLYFMLPSLSLTKTKLRRLDSNGTTETFHQPFRPPRQVSVSNFSVDIWHLAQPSLKRSCKQSW